MKCSAVVAVVCLILTGCASPSYLPDITAAKNPALGSAAIKPTHSHSIITGYVHRLPVAPQPWVKGDQSTPPTEQEQKK